MIAITSIFAFSACAQTKDGVPDKVSSAFSKKFPDAKKIKWDKENKMEWEAEFKIDGKEYSANFDLDGNWMETEYEIKKSEIPAAVKATLDADYMGYKIEEAGISESANGKVYEFELKQGKKETEVVIDANGKVMKDKEQGENEEDEEDDD